MSIETRNFIGDPSFTGAVQVSSIPADPNLFNFISGTIAANSQLNLVWTITPSQPQLSLWNFHITLRLGTNDDAHRWPEGASLTSDQMAVEVSIHTDALASNDNNNVRVNKVVLKNTSGSGIPYYFFYKCYSFSSSVGISS